MQPIIIAQSRSRWALYLVGSALFTTIGVLVVRTRNGMLIGWADIIFFGCATLLCARNLLDTRPRIVLDDNGVLDRTLKVGVIAWSDITDAYARSMHGQNFICLNLRDPEKYTSRLSPAMRRMVSLNAKLGFTDLSLNFAGTNANVSQLEALIQSRIRTTASTTS